MTKMLRRSDANAPPQSWVAASDPPSTSSKPNSICVLWFLRPYSVQYLPHYFLNSEVLHAKWMDPTTSYTTIPKA